MPAAVLARHLSEFRQINNNMRSLELDNQYLDEGLTDWLRNIAMAAALAAGSETADAKKIPKASQQTVAGKPEVKHRSSTAKPQESLLKVQAKTPTERKNLLKKWPLLLVFGVLNSHSF